MIIDPRQKSGRLVMQALVQKIAALDTITNNPNMSESDVADAVNDRVLARTLLDELTRVRDADATPQADWIMRGKSITQQIQELGSFEDQSLQVRLTFDGGETHKPISILTRRDGYAMLEYCGW